MSWIETYWIEALFGVIIAAIGAGFKRLCTLVKRERVSNVAIKDGLQAILRDRIVQAHHHFVYERGYCPVNIMESLISMHTEYKRLGGNGMVDKLMEDIKDLETENKGDKKQ